MADDLDPLPTPVTQAEREAWWELFDSVATELGLHLDSPRQDDDWLDCCLMHGPLHADDCPVRLAQARGPHRE